MPVFESIEALRASGSDWIDLERADLITLGTHDGAGGGGRDGLSVRDILSDGRRLEENANAIPSSRLIVPESANERVVVTGGDVLAETEAGTTVLGRNQWLDVPAAGVRLSNALPPVDGWRPPAELVRIGGRWPRLLGAGIFHFEPGRPCDYHHHDFDEYWFVYRGHAMARCAGIDTAVAPGFVLAAAAGEEHGLHDPSEVVEGVSFGARWTGRERPGHLWRDVHGAPDAPRR